MIGFLTQTKTLWVLFVLFLIQTVCFGGVMALWDFAIIDEMSDPEKIRHHIEGMTIEQRTVHAWMTATLDVAYPLTYGILFSGIISRTFRPVFAIPAIAVVPVDLIEGVVQVLILTGDDRLLWLKAYVTPLKLILFVAAIMITLFALVVEARNRRSQTS